MNLWKLSLTQRQPEIIQPNSLQALPSCLVCASFPEANAAALKDSPLTSTKAPLSLPLTYWVRLHVCSVSSTSSPLIWLWTLAQAATSSANIALPARLKPDGTKRNPGGSDSKFSAENELLALLLPCPCLLLALGLSIHVGMGVSGKQQLPALHGLQPLPSSHLPSDSAHSERGLGISVNPFSSQGGFVTERRVRCHFLCKKSKCHKKTLELF